MKRIFSTIAIILVLQQSAFAQSREIFITIPEHVTSKLQEEVIGGFSLGATGTSPRILAPLPLNLIKDFEQWVPNAYNDASKFCTIGYGHLIAKKPCVGSAPELEQFDRPLTPEAGLKVLDGDTATARLAVQNMVKTQLSDEQYGALVSFVFNVGAENFRTSTLLKYINNREFDGAIKQFPKWVISKRQILDGLIARRACEVQLFNGKLPIHPKDAFVRADCETRGAAPSAEELIDIDVGEGGRR